jgi:hypothetical protein
VLRVLPHGVLAKQEGFATDIPVGSACSTNLRQQYIDLTVGLGLETLVTLSKASPLVDLPCVCGSLIGREAARLLRFIPTKTDSSSSRR